MLGGAEGHVWEPGVPGGILRVTFHTLLAHRNKLIGTACGGLRSFPEGMRRDFKSSWAALAGIKQLGRYTVMVQTSQLLRKETEGLQQWDWPKLAKASKMGRGAQITSLAWEEAINIESGRENRLKHTCGGRGRKKCERVGKQ